MVGGICGKGWVGLRHRRLVSLNKGCMPSSRRLARKGWLGTADGRSEQSARPAWFIYLGEEARIRGPGRKTRGSRGCKGPFRAPACQRDGRVRPLRFGGVGHTHGSDMLREGRRESTRLAAGAPWPARDSEFISHRHPGRHLESSSLLSRRRLQSSLPCRTAALKPTSRPEKARGREWTDPAGSPLQVSRCLEQKQSGASLETCPCVPPHRMRQHRPHPRKEVRQDLMPRGSRRGPSRWTSASTPTFELPHH
jgi:hypothetical protein